MQQQQLTESGVQETSMHDQTNSYMQSKMHYGDEIMDENQDHDLMTLPNPTLATQSNLAIHEENETA